MKGKKTSQTYNKCTRGSCLLPFRGVRYDDGKSANGTALGGRRFSSFSLIVFAYNFTPGTVGGGVTDNRYLYENKKKKCEKHRTPTQKRGGTAFKRQTVGLIWYIVDILIAVADYSTRFTGD